MESVPHDPLDSLPLSPANPPLQLGTFEVRYTSRAKIRTTRFVRDSTNVFSGTEFHCVPYHLHDVLTIGRSSNEWLVDTAPPHSYRADCNSGWSFEDPTISAVHLRIYSIQFDEDGECDPLVFAEDLSSNGTFWNDIYIGRGRSAVILSHGDKLRLSDRITLVYQSKPNDEQERVFTHSQVNEVNSFKTAFEVTTKRIGSGGFANVYLAVKGTIKRQLACKLVDILAFREKETAQIVAQFEQPYRRDEEECRALVRKRVDESVRRKYHEIDVLREVVHPNIISTHKVYHSKESIYIFQELVTGGDLYSYCMHKGGNLEEHETGHIIRQVLEAVKYLHGKDIVHRDIKPENILVVSRRQPIRVVLTDFGEAKWMVPKSDSPLRRMTTLSGTYGYMAPEVTNLARLANKISYTPAVDLWSVGSVTYALIAGFLPFESFSNHTHTQTKNEAMRDEHDSATTIWSRLKNAGICPSHRLQDFIRKLLVVNESHRMTVQEALDHHWFTNQETCMAWTEAYVKAIEGWREYSKTDIVEEIPCRNARHKSRLRVGLGLPQSEPPPFMLRSSRPSPQSQTMRQLYRGESTRPKKPISDVMSGSLMRSPRVLAPGRPASAVGLVRNVASKPPSRIRIPKSFYNKPSSANVRLARNASPEVKGTHRNGLAIGPADANSTDRQIEDRDHAYGQKGVVADNHQASSSLLTVVVPAPRPASA